MHTRCLSLIFLIVANSYYLTAQSTPLYTIPTTKITISEITPDIRKDTVYEQEGFAVSQLITLKEYKEFLTFLVQEYDESKANNYLPDSSICRAEEDYIAYLTDTIYEKYPVLGVSWENAMSYCIWCSRVDEIIQEGSYYRLPNYTEYAAIRKKDSLHPELNLISEDYSEWSIVTQDESIFVFSQTIENLNFVYFPEDKHPQADKRKVILGNNFHFKRNNVYLNNFSKYQNIGYHYVGFRLLKTEIPPEEKSTIHTSLLKLYDYE